MEIRALPADALIIASGGLGLIFGRSTMSMASHRQRRQPDLPGRRQVRQRRVHPGPSHGHPRRRQAAADERERPRRRRPHLGPPPAARSSSAASRSPKAERYYFLEERYPKYGNLVPRDIATREIFNVCTREGLERGEGPALRLPRREPPAAPTMLDRKLGGILEIYEKFQGADPRHTAMKIFPGRALLDGRAVGATTSGPPPAAWRSARRGTSRPTSPASTPSASATTSTTGPIAWAPIRSCPASSAA